MKKAFYSIIILILFISITSCVVLYNLGDKILQAAIESELKNNSSKVILPNENKNSNSDNTSNKDSSNASNPIAEIGNDNNKGEKLSNNNSKHTETKSSPVPGTSTKASSNPNSNRQEQSQNKLFSEDEIKDIKDKVSFTDKMAASTIVLKRLTPTDIKELNNMVSGGITEEKKEKAKKIIYEKFTPEEVEKLKELYHKYMN